MAESGLLAVDGGRIYYEVDGAGSPLLLIHGGLGSLRMWDEQVPVFVERHQVIRYDTRGYGRTESEDVPFSHRGDAAAVLDHVGVSSAHVVGQSRGGMIALDFAIEYPARVMSFVSVASGVGGYEAPYPEGIAPPPWEEMERLWESKLWEPLAELETKVWVDGWGQPTTRIDPDLRCKVHDWILAGYHAEKAEGKPQPLDPSAARRLGEVGTPTLVLVGDADEPGCIAAERHLAASLPDARIVEFPGV